MDPEIPPLRIQDLPESKPPKSRFSVCGLALRLPDRRPRSIWPRRAPLAVWASVRRRGAPATEGRGRGTFVKGVSSLPLSPSLSLSLPLSVSLSLSLFLSLSLSLSLFLSLSLSLSLFLSLSLSVFLSLSKYDMYKPIHHIIYGLRQGGQIKLCPLNGKGPVGGKGRL